MNDKFYTPTLDEFHVGFEFEAKLEVKVERISEGKIHKVFYEKTRLGWEKCNNFRDAYLIADTDSFDTLESEIESGFVRVKNLDEEDILQCGWNVLDHIHGKSYTLESASSYTPHHLWNEGGFLVIKINTNEYIGRVFRGNIRNKSELLTIMKMVGIK